MMTIVKQDLACMMSDYSYEYNKVIYPNDPDKHIGPLLMVKLLRARNHQSYIQFISFSSYCLGAYLEYPTKELAEMGYEGFIDLLDEYFGGK